MSVLNCPVCQGAMREVNREGILIDVCTQCRGVWLDRGELEKLAAYMPAPMEAQRPIRPAPGPAPDATYRDDFPPRERRRDRDDDDDDDDRYERDRRYGRDGDDYRGHPQRSKMARFLDFFD